MRRAFFFVTTAAGILVLALALGEGALRLFAAPPASGGDERNLLFGYDAELGWLPEPHGARRYLGARLISPHHNALGFRDHELGPKERPRIAFLGDSFVWGLDAEEGERFTDLLAARLSGWEVLNLGVCGYGTDQEYLLLRRFIDRLAPDVVFLVFCAENDRDDNTMNVRYGGYFKPYFVLEPGGAGARLAGVPVPRGERAWRAAWPRLFRSRIAAALAGLAAPAEIRVADPTEWLILAVRDLARARGARFALGFTRRDLDLERLGREEGFATVDLSTDERFAVNGAHWSPRGHAIVAERIERLLEAERLLERR
jgi:lysophospholipase L1-like esterase